MNWTFILALDLGCHWVYFSIGTTFSTGPTFPGARSVLLPAVPASTTDARLRPPPDHRQRRPRQALRHSK